MAKLSTTYVCDACGTQSPMQMGRCPRCGAWDSMKAKVDSSSFGPGLSTKSALTTQVQTLHDIENASLQRFPSGINEIDEVLGGGWVIGSVLLIAGEPGIGKSTLLLQLAQKAQEKSVLYVSGEESLAQVKMRAERLGVSGNMQLTRETDARALADYIRLHIPDLIIVDSIQTLLAEEGNVPGSITQVRDATALLTQATKDVGSTLVLIGHVTKQGNIAGPKVIEHMVDATFALESAAGFRVLRAIKNRFGPAGEMAVFEMRGEGMHAVANPSEAFLAERPKGVPGSVVVAALEGQRPLLLEVQALAAKSPYASPRRIVQGLDLRRVDMILAVLERRLELPLAGLDIYVNVAGGLRLTDTGTDLAVAIAVYSAITNRTVPDDTVVTGEIGLAGEVRSVPQLERRRDEAARAKYDRFISPSSSVKQLSQVIEQVWA
ncbi:MAG: DNA repair protein RadA [Trueperaceae bacterium]|nr:DNA repair protein RadA [Trueperaceae bacterium]